MGMVVLLGFEVILGIAIGLILTIIGLFVKDICLFESLASGIILGVVAHKLWQLSPLIAVGIGIVAVVLLYFLQNTAIGFWLVGGVYSVAWGFIVALLVFDSTGKNMSSTYIGWAIGAAAFFGLHLFARSRQHS